MFGSDPIFAIMIPLLCLFGCIATVLSAARIWRRLHEDFPGGGFVETTRGWMTDHEAQLEEMAQLLNSQSAESPTAVQMRHQEAQEFQSDMSSRLARVEGDLSDLRFLAMSFATHEDHARLVDSLGQQMQTLGNPSYIRDGLAGLEERIEALETQLSGLVSSLEETGWDGKGEVEHLIDNLTLMAHTIKDEVAASHQQVLQVNEYALKMQKSASQVSDIEGLLVRLARDVAECRKALPPDSMELPPGEFRMDKQAEAYTISSATKKRPKLISPEGRAKYREVVDLAHQGKTLGDIALMTELDITEIGLMLGGETPSTRG